MNRREILRRAAAGSLAALFTPASAALRPARVSPRIAMTTACLRDRIPGRLQPGMQAVLPELQLYDSAAFLRDTFGIRNLEIWSRQIPDDSDAYCGEIRRRTQIVGSRLVNIQLDGPYNLSARDPAERTAAIAYVRHWIDRTALCGSPRMRVNLDDGKMTDPFDPVALAPILRELQDYATTRRIQLLLENHNGHSKKIANVAEQLRVTHDPRIGAVLDWGNSSAASFPERLADFRLLFPYLAFVSAKGLHFDAAGRHIEYPVEAIVDATEATGFRGIYSIELYTSSDFPDPIVAGKSMLNSIQSRLRS